MKFPEILFLVIFSAALPNKVSTKPLDALAVFTDDVKRMEPIRRKKDEAANSGNLKQESGSVGTEANVGCSGNPLCTQY